MKTEKESILFKIYKYCLIKLGITYIIIMLYIIPTTMFDMTVILKNGYKIDCVMECVLFNYSLDRNIYLESDEKYCACVQYDKYNHNKNIKFVERLK